MSNYKPAANEVYTTYYRSAQESGTPLSPEEFQKIWEAITPRERADLFTKFRRGKTSLTKEVIDQADDLFKSLECGISEDEIDPVLLQEIRALSRKHDFRSR